MEAAGVSWLDGSVLVVTCGCLSSVEDVVEAAGGLAVQYDSFLPNVLIRTVLKTLYGDLSCRAKLRAQGTAKKLSG
jgi:hypothetical protein